MESEPVKRERVHGNRNGEKEKEEKFSSVRLRSFFTRVYYMMITD